MIFVVIYQIQDKSAVRAAHFGAFFSTDNMKAILLLHFNSNQLKWLFYITCNNLEQL